MGYANEHGLCKGCVVVLGPVNAPLLLYKHMLTVLSVLTCAVCGREVYVVAELLSPTPRGCNAPTLHCMWL